MDLSDKQLEFYKSLVKTTRTIKSKTLEHYFSYLLLRESKEAGKVANLEGRSCQYCGRRFQELDTDYKLDEGKEINETSERCAICEQIYKHHKLPKQKVMDMYGVTKEKRNSIETFTQAVETNQRPKPNSFNLYNFLKNA